MTGAGMRVMDLGPGLERGGDGGADAVDGVDTSGGGGGGGGAVCAASAGALDGAMQPTSSHLTPSQSSNA